jgi:hypothetical protein
LYTYNCASNRLEYLNGTFVSRLGLHLEEADESNNSNQNGSDGYDDLFDIEINNEISKINVEQVREKSITDLWKDRKCG